MKREEKLLIFFFAVAWAFGTSQIPEQLPKQI